MRENVSNQLPGKLWQPQGQKGSKRRGDDGRFHEIATMVLLSTV